MVAGGAANTVIGVGLSSAPTGVTQVIGGTLISTGIPTIGLGFSKMALGMSDKNSDHIGGGLTETIGIAVDKKVGDGSNKFQTIGAFTDGGISLLSGAPTNLPGVISAANTTTGLIGASLNYNSGEDVFTNVDLTQTTNTNTSVSPLVQHKITSGQTLGEIASVYNVSVKSIMNSNSGNKAIKDKDTIYADQTITIPKQ